MSETPVEILTIDECISELRHELMDYKTPELKSRSEMILERIIAELSAERAKVKELEYANAKSGAALDALTAQNAVMHEALVKVDKEKDGLSFTCANAVIRALSITPSDAAEMSRKKDELINMLFKALSKVRPEIRPDSCDDLSDEMTEQYYDDLYDLADNAIEAARAAGVEGMK